MKPNLLALRHTLHRIAELSNKEKKTSEILKSFINTHNPTEVIENVAGNGFAAIYRFKQAGPVVVIRCELDALPIKESLNITYASQNPNCAHKCGHDGHMAIVAGLIFELRREIFKKGTVILLFQPAEETGEGAKAVLKDARFTGLKPDYIFALHNIPGYPQNEIILSQNRFSATVHSFSLKLEGKQAHAAQPEQGINPALAIADMIKKLAQLERPNPMEEKFMLCTPIFIEMGQQAYGISAGQGAMGYTLRCWNSNQMQEVESRVAEIIKTVAAAFNLKYSLKWFDYFPENKNDSQAVAIVEKAALQCGYRIHNKNHPFRFGEDFGWFSNQYKTAMFGLGAGEKCPALHHTAYDFPDEIIETGVQMFTKIIQTVLNE